MGNTNRVGFFFTPKECNIGRYPTLLIITQPLEGIGQHSGDWNVPEKANLVATCLDVSTPRETGTPFSYGQSLGALNVAERSATRYAILSSLPVT